MKKGVKCLGRILATVHLETHSVKNKRHWLVNEVGRRMKKNGKIPALPLKRAQLQTGLVQARSWKDSSKATDRITS